MGKSCELCNSPARMFCESDQASLCWDCDYKVHSANFLVARHSRNLLCHACQSLTGWSASGSKLGPTISVCDKCVGGVKNEEVVGGEMESRAGNNDEIDTEGDRYGDEEEDDDDEDDEDEDEDDEDMADEDEDGDNQVVPWSSTPPPPAASSSCSEETSGGFPIVDREISLKRIRDSVSDLRSDDDISCSSSHWNHRTATPVSHRGGEAAYVDSLPRRPLKTSRTETNQPRYGSAGPRSATAIVESLKRLHEQDMSSGDEASAAIAGICRLSRNPSVVDLNSAESPYPSKSR